MAAPYKSAVCQQPGQHQTRVTNLFVVALTVSAFKTMIGFKVAISALGAWLIVRSRSDGMDTWRDLIRLKVDVELV